jgi:2-C-methyl-D-erythritol 4-phosphate cytidylyltransferase
LTDSTLTIAIILAAGDTTLQTGEEPKSLVRLAGRPIIEHSILAFQNNGSIDEVVIVTNAASRSAIERIILSGGFSKVKNVLLGGINRADSAMAAIRALESRAQHQQMRLIFHDVVRPLVSQRIINDVISALDAYKAVGTAIDTADTIIRTDPLSTSLKEVLNRGDLRNSQTPQGFSFELIQRAYQLASEAAAPHPIDECDAVLKYLPGEPIFLVKGEVSNIRFEQRSDLHILDKFLQLRSVNVAAKGVDALVLSKLRDKVVIVLGGTSGIGAAIVQVALAYHANVVAASRSTNCDIRRPEEIDRVLNDTQAKYGHIDMVINTAGVLWRQPLIDMTPTQIQESIDINYRGAINVALTAFPFLRQSGGVLINFTSSSYTYGRALYSIYSSAKAAIVNLTQALADEWLTHRIRVNCINPERTATPMRTATFGLEAPETLLRPETVAFKTLLVGCGNETGQIVDIKHI